MIIKENYYSNIWKYYIYQFLYGFSLVSPIITIFYLASGISFSQISLIVGVGYLGSLLFEIPSGSFADLIGRKYSISLGLFLMAISYILIGYYNVFIIFLVAAFINGIGESLISGSEESLLYDSLKKEKEEKKYKKIAGRGNSIFYASVIIASLFGAYLYTKLDILIFYFSAISFFLASIIILTMKEINLKNEKFNLKTQIKHIKSSFITIINNKKLIWLVFFSTITGGFMSLYANLLNQPYMQFIGFDIKTFGILAIGIFGARSISSLISYKIEEKLGEKNSIYFIIISQILIFLCLAYFNYLFSIIFVFMLFFIRSFEEIIMENYLHKHMNSKQRATLFSISNFSDSIIMIISFYLFGILIDLTSITFSLYILALGILFAGFLMLYLKPNSN